MRPARLCACHARGGGASHLDMAQRALGMKKSLVDGVVRFLAANYRHGRKRLAEITAADSGDCLLYWKYRTAERISAAPYGFGTNRLSRGNSLLFGRANPVTTIKWIGGHLSLIAAANRSPSIEPGMLISVMTSWISRTLSSTSMASSASNVAITLCPPPSRIARKYSLIKNSSSTVKNKHYDQAVIG